MKQRFRTTLLISEKNGEKKNGRPQEMDKFVKLDSAVVKGAD